jgi:hypothetical protein
MTTFVVAAFATGVLIVLVGRAGEREIERRKALLDAMLVRKADPEVGYREPEVGYREPGSNADTPVQQENERLKAALALIEASSEDVGVETIASRALGKETA